MTLSRRKFIRAGVLATFCAPLLPLKAVLAEDGPGTNPPSLSPDSVERLGYYTESTFAPYVNTKFRVYLAPSNTRGLKLVEVSDYLASLSRQASATVPSDAECFSLLFAIPSGKPFTQDTYLVEHDALGTFYMFVVPIGPHDARNLKRLEFYEAVFYRHQQFVGGQETADAAGTKRTGAATAAQLVQNQQPVAVGAPLIIMPGRENADTRSERDIYRFRPAETESLAVAEQKKETRPKKKEVYPLTLDQAPSIKGLKLGMTPEQVLALFPGSKADEEVRSELSSPPSRFGVSSFMIRPEKYSSASKFEGVSQIVFTLLDGRVSTLHVGYDRPVWGHVDEFVTKFAERRGLPAADAWEAYVGLDDQLKTLKCKEFEISLFAGGKNVSINYVQMRDLLALKKYKERRASRK